MELLLWRMERRKTSGWWVGTRAMGRPDRPYTRLGHRGILVDCFFSRVRIPCAYFHALTLLSNSIYYLYALIRRPRLILDFALTLMFNHLVLTTYYSASIPTSLFFWLVMFAGSAWTVMIAEQLCVKREMTEGLVISAPRDEADEMEMGGLLRRD